MIKRVTTAAIGIPILVVPLLLGGVWLRLAIAAVAVAGMAELFRGVGAAKWGIEAAAYLATLLYIVLLPELGLYVPLAILVMSVAVAHITDASREGMSVPVVAVTGFVYIAVMLGFVAMIRELPGGVHLVWLVFLSAWGSDTFAYFVGRGLGRTKLAPVLSPSKTLEGAVGGVMGAALAGAAYAWVLGQAGAIGTGAHLAYAVICAIASVASVFGDLSASAIKRSFGIKDFGKIFPGHGGILDRFDSVLFTAPIIYIAYNVGNF